jgi:hypothetical protein
VGQRLVLQEVDQVAQGLELLNQGVALLQKWTRDQEWPPPGEAWEHYQQLARELGLAEGEKHRRRRRRPWCPRSGMPRSW